jgi:hypothetical protein
VSATNKTCTTSFSISTKLLDYVYGTFRIPSYDVPNTHTKYINVKLEVEETKATAESQISAGLRHVYNQSHYFAHNGDSIKTAHRRVGNTPYEPQTLKERFNSPLQHFNIHQEHYQECIQVLIH